MFGSIVKKIIGSKNDRYLKSLRPVIQQINAYEEDLQQWNDNDFSQRIAELKNDVQENGTSLTAILPEAFAGGAGNPCSFTRSPIVAAGCDR